MDGTIDRGGLATARERRAMVDNQIRTFDVTDPRVLNAFETVPREVFLPATLASLAYSDAVLKVGEGSGARRVMLVPMVLARMIQGLDLAPTDRVLVVAAGTGYSAALAAGLSDRVIALEADAVLAELIRNNCYHQDRPGVEAVAGPLNEGWPSQAPYNAILVCGAIEVEPERLLKQLTAGGRLVAIQVGSNEASPRSGKVLRYERIGGAEVSSRPLFDATAPVLDGFSKPAAFAF